MLGCHTMTWNFSSSGSMHSISFYSLYCPINETVTRVNRNRGHRKKSLQPATDHVRGRERKKNMCVCTLVHFCTLIVRQMSSQAENKISPPWDPLLQISLSAKRRKKLFSRSLQPSAKRKMHIFFPAQTKKRGGFFLFKALRKNAINENPEREPGLMAHAWHNNRLLLHLAVAVKLRA